MWSQSIARWVGQTKKRMLGAKSDRRKAQRPAERRLLLESLEGRELMAVATIGRDWKDLEFTGTASLSGGLSGKYGSQPVNGSFSGNLAIDGELDYSSAGDAVGQGGATGPVNGKIYGYGNLPTLNIDGDTAEGGMTETAGKFKAVLPADGALGEVVLTGTINTRDFSVSGNVGFTLYDTIKGSGRWSGKLSMVDTSPLTVSTTAAWDADKFGVVDIHVDLGGGVQKAATRTTAIAKVDFYWGDSTGKRLNKLADSIPLVWNQKSGDYELSALPKPPATATKLHVVTTIGKTSSSLTLDLPARPTLSISNVQITPPATGTVDLVFTVTLSGPTLSPVTVKYATANGTAIVRDDYTARSGKLTFPVNGPLTQTIAVKVKADATLANQDFYMKLTAPTWATLNGTGIGTGSIIDIV